MDVLLALTPLMLGAAVVLSRYLSLPAAPNNLVRPLLITLVIAAAAVILLRLLSRSWAWASLLASLFITFTLREAVLAAVIGAFVLWWLVVMTVRGLRNQPQPKGTAAVAARVAAVFGVALLGVTTVSVALATWGVPQSAVPRYSAPEGERPNIYLILLDGYPRADTLAEVFEIDNSAFLTSLERIGFTVADEAASSYNKTWLTLASMLNLQYLDDLMAGQQPPATEPEQIRWLQELINEAALLELLRDHGYEIHALAPFFTSTALTSADEYHDYGHITEFEASLMSASPWAVLLRDQIGRLVGDSLESSIVNGLDVTTSLARMPASEPQFVFAHLHSPHTPFVLGHADPIPPACAPNTCNSWDPSLDETGLGVETYRNALSKQLEVLNDLVLTAVNSIVAADANAVIVVMSDHGTRYSLADGEEHFRILLAARTPGSEGLIADDESPVNALRKLASAYFHADVPPLPYRAWLSDWNRTLDLTPMSPDGEAEARP